MSRTKQARDTIKSEAVANGGVYAIADAAGLHYTQIYAFLRGKTLTPENAGKLRAALPSVPADVWADAFAPMPDDEVEAEDAA